METIFSTPHAQMWGVAGKQIQIDDQTVDLPYEGLFVTDCCLNDMSDQGKGYGKELYARALAQFGVLYSIFPVSDDAFRVHDALIRTGLVRSEQVNADYGITALVRV